MKKFSFCFFVFISFNAFSQPVTLTGRIDHPADHWVYVSRYTDWVSYDEITVDSARIDKHGHFSMTFEWTQPGIANFTHGEEYTELYLCPGMKAHLTLDTEAFDETMTHSGDGAAINNYLAINMVEQGNWSPEGYKKSRADFVAHIDSLYTVKEARLKKLEASIGVSSDCEDGFLKMQQADIRYLKAYEMLEYPRMNRYFNRNASPQKPVADEYAFLQDIPINEPQAVSSEHYRMFLESYINYSCGMLMQQDTSRPYPELKEAFIRTQFDGPVLELVYADLIYEQLTYLGNLEYGEKYLEWFGTQYPNSMYQPALVKALETARILTAGNPAPDFSAVDKAGKTVRLSDFKGKYVYLDIWATWCGPCVSEIPAMEDLIKWFEGEDIVFVSVSVDDNQGQWNTFIDKKNMHGVQLHSPGGFESGIAKHYGVKGIPRYVLIDKAGTIIDGNAKRPGQIRDQLNELMD